MATFRIRHIHSIIDIYYVEASSKEEAEEIFLDEMLGEEEPDDTVEDDDLGEVEVIRVKSHK